MLLKIQPDAAVPIYEQVVAQVIFNIASGAMEAGELIPSCRDLAQQLIVNPNTIARAFQELERQGIVTAKRGRGMEVTAEAPQLCRSQRQEIIRVRIREAFREAASSALPEADLRKIVEEELATVHGRRLSKHVNPLSVVRQ
jgi:GntR family transcriptional regulator